MVQRYDPDIVYGSSVMEEYENGDYVLYSDYEELQKELSDLKRRVDSVVNKCSDLLSDLIGN